MKAKKRVAVMCFSDADGGMELDTIKLAGLLQERCEVTVFCKAGSFIHQRLKEQSSIRFVKIDSVSRTFSLAMLFSVRAVIKSEKIRNVVFFGASELKTLYFSFLWLDLNVIVRHGTTKFSQKRDLLHRIIYSCVTFHVALSNHLLKNVKFIVPENDKVMFKIIYPSYVYEKGCGIQKQSAYLRLTHVGRIAKGKGQVDAVKACAILFESGIDFRLELVGSVGDDEYMQELELEINRSQYSDKVLLTGFVEDTQSILENTDVFLFPSFGEGMPNAFIEALHCGIPCLAYDNTVFPEFSEMGFYITIATHRDEADLAEKLLSIANNIVSVKRESSLNALKVKDYFDKERELSDWLEILK